MAGDIPKLLRTIPDDAIGVVAALFGAMAVELSQRAQELDRQRARADRTHRHIGALASLPALVETYRAQRFDDLTIHEMIAAIVPPETARAYMTKADELAEVHAVEARALEIMRLRREGRTNVEIGGAVSLHAQSVGRIIRQEIGATRQPRRRASG